ncbi:methylmalonyl-CoA epimerase [Paenibacillus cellulosilyticus]|uniref:Methylmalonyl-CoA epimerase n=1 Tax=Paenibacillus cellulosilyticus TaxID=375489 RepID=A0A2V2YV59_9BACL|nr:VOC family protein [Paenibacillus cellulosilyticus]PWW04857.1 methylmalonyl-CoA epimerase [Paenibacillus cellulosilyticus]QKS45969.1 VOC family protein [Paenibacillus cellulosilyticus]
MRGVHHVGWVVKDIKAAIPSALELLGPNYTVGEIVHDRIRQVFVCFLTSEGSCAFELIQPDSGQSPVADLLGRSGATVYHICMQVEDIDAEIGKMTSRGCLVVSGKSPAPAIDGRNVAFVYDMNLGLIEIVE